MSSTTLSPGRQARKQVAWAATVALTGVVYFAVIIVALHTLRPDHNPMAQVTSEYAVGPYGYLMTSAFLSMSIASFALLLALRRGVPQPARSQVGLIFLGLWGVGLLIAMIFPIDVEGAPQTTAGTIHVINGPLAFLSLTVSVLLISRRFKYDETWRPFHGSARFLSLVILIGFIGLPLMRNIPDLAFAGLVQRIVLAAFVMWAIFVAARLRSTALESLSI